MKNSRIVRAYDSINPSPAEKAKMLDAILAEANLEEKPVRQRKKKEPVVYTARPTKVSKRSTVMTNQNSILAEFMKIGENLFYIGLIFQHIVGNISGFDRIRLKWFVRINQ
jgi:hypothetical protein